jgi:cytochrome c biogenesis protein CcdA/thiol-disulfide isomerase/thioredoxin
MTLFLVSFIAGVLTVLAPCILPLLPVVVGSSANGRSKLTPYVVIASLAISIIAFTFLLKVSTAFISIPPYVWSYLSGGILAVFGLTLLFPTLWEKIPLVSKLSLNSNKALGQGYQKKSLWGDALIGAALGPVFSTCSPTYFVILATVLPTSFFLGTLYLLAYVLGLALVLLLIALIGERLTKKLGGLADSRGYFKKIIGVLFVIIGLLIVLGLDKKIETKILDSGYFDVTKLEYKLLESIETEETGETKEVIEELKAEALPVVMKKEAKPATKSLGSYVEFVNPSGFVNTGGESIKMSDYVGKDIILLEVMTYSCINCQRTFPYMNDWYEKYKDEGLTVIGLHTPEFAFEKEIKNVEVAMKKYGIDFPVVLDNNYETWNAYGNRFWPRRYLIDLEGNIVFDHIGEGKYEETEAKIVRLLAERKVLLGIE